MGRGLSKQQQDILLDLLRETNRQIHRSGKPSAWGVWWYNRIPQWLRQGYGPKSQTAAYRASLSRALKRLEERGLVVRQNCIHGFPGHPEGRAGRVSKVDPAPKRTTNVVLTAEGRAIAERLIG